VACPLQRVQHAVGMIDPFEVVIHLRAERAAGERMVGIAVQAFGGTVLDLDDPMAGVRTIVAACAANDL